MQAQLGVDRLADGDLGVDQVRDAVEHAAATLEIVDSRIEGWDITFGDTVADNASSGMFVLGDRRVPLTASISGLGTVSATFAKGEQA